MARSEMDLIMKMYGSARDIDTEGTWTLCERELIDKVFTSVPVLTDAFTPEGLRKVLGLTKMYAKDLKERGLCPKCEGEHKNLCLPSTDFCEICCFKVALGIA